MNNIAEIIGRNLLRLRLEAGLTHVQLADKMDCYDEHAISRWECGRNAPTAYYLYQIAKALGCTIDELFRED